jgi:MATE family multidrug resistance protein
VIPFVPSGVELLGFEPEVAGLMSEYLSIRLLSVGAVVGMEALGNFYGGLGNTKLQMQASVVVMLANFVALALLVEPHFGLPGYGVAGAAWAAVGSTWLGFAVIAVAFVTGAGFGDIPRGPIGFRKDELVRVLRFGLPNGVNWFLEFAALTLFLNVVVGHLGTTVLAAMNVVIQVSSVAFMPTFGLASAGAILVGETIGAKRHDGVPRIVKMTAITGSVWMVSVAAVYVTIPGVIMAQFVPRDVPAEELIATGAYMLMLSSLWQIFDAIGMTMSEALRAAGDTTWCMWARIILAWFVFIPVSASAIFVFHEALRS